jgi:hypothetical protein
MTATEDIESIRYLLAEYCLSSDENRHDDWANLFADGGGMYAFRKDWIGHDVLVGFISNAPEGIHLNTSVRIDLDGDSATALSNFVFFTNDKAVGSMGLYADDIVRTTKGWRFTRRAIRMAKPSQPDS